MPHIPKISNTYYERKEIRLSRNIKHISERENIDHQVAFRIHLLDRSNLVEAT